MTGFRRARILNPPPSPLDAGLTSFSACDETVDQAGCHPSGSLKCLALLLTHAGRARSRANDIAFTHRPRRLVAVAEGVIYEERLPPGAWWHLSYLLLRGPWCEPINQALRRRPGGMLAVDQAPIDVRLLLTSTVEASLSQPRRWSWSAVATLANLLGELLGRAEETDTTLTARVARLLDQEPQRSWTIATVAFQLRLTPATFVRRFTAEAGTAPAGWIRRYRIEQALRLLEQNLDVATVAESLGFANPYHFSRVFKAITGKPPSLARSSNMVSPLHAGVQV